MNKEQIIQMAREVGLPHWYETEGLVNEALLIKFADLVAKAEREECLKFCDQVAEYFPSSGFVGSFIGSQIRHKG
jgi:hypothetical protein